MLSQSVAGVRQRLPFYIVAAASLLLFARLSIFVWKNAVNLLFWDQWDFYTPLFEGSSPWTIFRWQHGPHRQGVGFLLDSWLASHTGWNTRVEGLAIAGTMFAAMVVALLLKRRLFGRLTWPDLIMPPLFLTLGNYEMLIGPSNPSHGSMPLLLLMLYCLGWTLRRVWLKYVVVLILNFLLIYTGFGLFAGIITMVLLAVQCAKRLSSFQELRWPLVALVVSIMSFASFFVGYTHQPAAECFQFPHSNPFAYPWYAALMLANFVHLQGAHLWPSIVGILLLTLFWWALVARAFRLWRTGISDSPSLVIVVLLSFSLLFALTAAVGRVCLGMDTAIASRYVPYMAPGFLAVYFHLLTLRASRLRNASLVLFTVVSLYAGTHLTNLERGGVYWFREGKRRWRECYLRVEKIDECNRKANFAVHPNPEGTRLKEKLDYLKKHELNLYSPSSAVGN